MFPDLPAAMTDASRQMKNGIEFLIAQQDCGGELDGACEQGFLALVPWFRRDAVKVLWDALKVTVDYA